MGVDLLLIYAILVLSVDAAALTRPREIVSFDGSLRLVHRRLALLDPGAYNKDTGFSFLTRDETSMLVIEAFDGICGARGRLHQPK